MAKMFPTQYPKPPNPDDPEFEVFEVLRKLPEQYTVFYSKKFKGTGSWKEESEIDFIVFDHELVLLCLEVKGGMIEYDGEQDCWLQNGDQLTLSPDRQASAGMHNVLAFLGPDARNLNLGWVLVFPNCCLPNNFRPPAGVPDRIIIDQERLNLIEEAVKNLRQYYVDRVGRAGISAATAKSIQDRLTRGIGFVSKIGVRIARDNQQLLELTEEQFKVLEDLEINERTVVRGFAGTGKTVLATEYARRLTAQGTKVLVLFYNRLIAKKVARSFDRDSNIACTRFFKFAKQMITKVDAEWWDQNFRRGDDSFWTDDVPLKLLDLPKEEVEEFDAIIVDEGQDFKSEWFAILEELLSGKESDRFVVFYDELQDVFGRWSDLPWGGRGVARKQLTQNCRNTKSIIKFLNGTRPTGMVPFANSPQGERVIERKFSDPGEVENSFVEDFQALLRDGINPGQVVVLLNQPKKESSLANVTRIGRTKIEAITGYYNENSRTIQFTSIEMFKGLEADVIFLLLPLGSNSCSKPELLYVQGSRARTLLYVYS